MEDELIHGMSAVATEPRFGVTGGNLISEASTKDAIMRAIKEATRSIESSSPERLESLFDKIFVEKCPDQEKPSG